MRLGWGWGEKLTKKKKHYQHFVTVLWVHVPFWIFLPIKIHRERRPAVQKHSRLTNAKLQSRVEYFKDRDSFTFKLTLRTPVPENTDHTDLTDFIKNDRLWAEDGLDSWNRAAPYIYHNIGQWDINISRTAIQLTYLREIDTILLLELSITTKTGANTITLQSLNQFCYSGGM